jgi:zinc protease
LKVALANGQAQPEVLFNQALDAAVSQNHPRAQPLTAAGVDRMNLDKSLAFYKDRFADASDFIFVFVGSFDLPTMKPLVETYLGSLPSERRKEMVKDVGIRPPTGIVEKQVKSGIAPRSQVSIVFTGPFQNDQQHRVIATAMADTLAGNLQRTLREDLGGTYGVSVVPRFTKRPTPEYRITISFACDPARTDSLVKTAFQVIDTYKKLGPGPGQVTDTRAALLRDLETNLATNEYLLNQILFKYEFGEDVNEIYNMRPFYDQITAAALRDAAQHYLDTTRYVEVRLLPETR